MPSRGIFRPRGRSVYQWGFKRKGENGRTKRVNEVSEQAEWKSQAFLLLSAKSHGAKIRLDGCSPIWSHSLCALHQVLFSFPRVSMSQKRPRYLLDNATSESHQVHHCLFRNYTCCDCSTLEHMICLSKKHTWGHMTLLLTSWRRHMVCMKPKTACSSHEAGNLSNICVCTQIFQVPNGICSVHFEAHAE